MAARSDILPVVGAVVRGVWIIIVAGIDRVASPSLGVARACKARIAQVLTRGVETNLVVGTETAAGVVGAPIAIVADRDKVASPCLRVTRACIARIPAGLTRDVEASGIDAIDTVAVVVGAPIAIVAGRDKVAIPRFGVTRE